MEAPLRDPQVSPQEDVAELHLLISEMDDELTRYRWREAVWISLVIHVLAFVAIIFAPRWIPRGVVVLPITPTSANSNTTFLEMPSDKQQVKTPPKTDIISDKNRIAESKTPLPSKDLIRKLLDARQPGRPAQPPPQPQQQAMQQQNPAQGQQQQQATPSPTPPALEPVETARLQQPPQRPAPNPFKTAAPGIQGAIESMPASHGTKKVSFTVGNHGYSPLNPNSIVHGDVEILSDTMGVDFSDYLQRVKYALETNWYNLIPEGARYKHGKLKIQFAIVKNGTATGELVVLSSGDLTMDRPAYGSITASSPFDPLPNQFPGSFLALRVTFYYNPDPRTDAME